MARSYKFSIIQARPDNMRGERVNVGLAVWGENGLDIRMPEIRKLRHLTGHNWDDIANAYSSALAKASEETGDLISADNPLGFRSETFVLGKLGSLVASNPQEYEIAVKKILFLFVDKPSLSKKEKQQRINSEISAMLRKVGVLGHRGDSIEDGKVIANFVVSEEKDIVADFAYKPNGLKVVSTLELRGITSAAHGKACEKGATLYFAKDRYKSDVKVFGVYAASPAETETHRSEIEILRSFADGNAFNWMNPQDRQKFQSSLY